MNDDPNDVLRAMGCLEALGLRAGDTLSLLASTPMRSMPTVGGGIASTRSWSQVAALAFALLWSPTLSSVAQTFPTVASVAATPGVGFESSMEREGFVKLVGVEADVLPLAGAVRIVEGLGRGCGVLLDGHGEGSAVRLIGASGEVVAVARGGTFRLYRVDRTERTRASTQSRATEVSVPWEAFLADRSCASWLREHVVEAARSPVLIERVGAAGTLGRLWMPTSAVERASVLRGGFETPVDRVRTWARGLDSATRDRLGRRVEEALGDLHDALAALEDRNDPSEAARLTANLCRRRDTLESVAFVLRGANSMGSLPSDLRQFDAQARSRMQWFVVDDDLRGDPLLAAAALENPSAWWGSLLAVS